MSEIDATLAANQEFAERFRLSELPMPPARGLAVLTCMDARLTIENILGLDTGDAHVIRNAGGIATDDALRSLIISHHLLGTREIMVVNHTFCGMLTFNEEELQTELEEKTGTAAVTPAHFHAFSDVDHNVRRQVQRVRSHPWIPETLPVRGFVYSVETGRLTEVQG